MSAEPNGERSDPAGSRRRGARLVMALGILSGVAGLVSAPLVAADQVALASDVYYYAAEALLSGGDIYEVTPPDREGFHYIYPPIVAFGFVPHALLGSPAASYALQTALNAAFALGLAAVLRRALSRRGVSLTRLDELLLVGFALCSAYSAITVVNGQVNIALAFALGYGLDALDRNRGTVAGAAFAAAALVKVFPAVMGLWLLRRRAYRGVVAATAVGTAGLAAGALALGPDTTVTYFSEVLTGRYDGFDGAPEPTQTRGGAQRQVAALFDLGPPLVTPVAGAVLAPVLAWLYLNVETDSERQAAILGTLLVTLLFFPLQRLYGILLAVPLVILLYTLPTGRARTVLVAGALVSFLRVDYEAVAMGVTALGLPGGLESALLSVTASAFEVVLPPTLGMWLLLAGCVLVHREQPSNR